MNIIVVGISHKTAPVDLREMLAVPESRLGEALSRLATYPGIQECLLLSTCNRVEVYATIDQVERGYAGIQEFLVDTHFALSSDQLVPHLYWNTGDRAIAHLFRVASSLDSMVLGEPQILGQLKDAFEIALSHKTSGVILNKLVKKAISVAKRVRTETRIAENAVSVSYAAVELAKKIFSNLSEKTVLLVGAGEMAQLAAQHLINQGVRHVLISTRDSHRAVELAERFHGVSVPFDTFRRDLAQADIILCSTGASHYLITFEDVQRAVRQRMNRPVFLIDISVPRNIDPAVKDVDNAFLFNIDDLEMRVEQNVDDRRREADHAERIIEEEVLVILQWLKSLEVTPTIVALKKRAEEIKQAEIEKVLSRMGSLSQQDRSAIEALAAGIANKFLHWPLVTLKAEAHSGNGAIYAEAARRFFRLEDTIPLNGVEPTDPDSFPPECSSQSGDAHVEAEDEKGHTGRAKRQLP